MHCVTQTLFYSFVLNVGLYSYIFIYDHRAYRAMVQFVLVQFAFSKLFCKVVATIMSHIYFHVENNLIINNKHS